MSQRRMLGLTTFMLMGVLPLPLAAVVVPFGVEFQVNTYTPNNQQEHAVCRDAAGNFVVAWNSPQDGAGDGIIGQRFNALGQKRGTEFQVNTHTTGQQVNPALCCDVAGNFVVTWEAEADGDSDGIFARRFDRTGQAQGTEFQVNTYTTADQEEPDINCDPAGNFVAVWESDTQDGDGRGVFGQRYDSNATPQGTEFQVNTYTTDRQEDTQICCDSSGNFTVAWESYGQDGSKDSVFAQRYDSSGMAQGTEFQVNTYTTSDQEDAAINCDAAGNFVVAWDSLDQDGDGRGVFAQRFDSAGMPQGTEFQVNSYTTNSQREPAVCCDENGNITVAWESLDQDGSGNAVVATQYSSGGTPLSGEFLLNTYTTSDQDDAALVCGPEGQYVAVWVSSRQDGSADGLFARLFGKKGTGVPALGFAGATLSALALVGFGAWNVRRKQRRR